MKNFRLDSHKLHFHLDRVLDFQHTGDCYPIYMEVSPVGLCNHRCVFCAYDYIEYPNRKLDKTKFFSFVDEIAKCGLKSMLYAGEGEPLMHPNIAEFVQYTKERGVDVGMFSNGALLREKLCEEILPHLTFLRFSFNAGTASFYSKIHRVEEKIFDKVVKNIEYASQFRERQKLSVDLGSQFVLLPENKDSLIEAVKTMKNVGVDFISIKPFVFQNENQQYDKTNKLELSEVRDLISQAIEYESEDFRVIFRENAFINKETDERGYTHCRGCNFITVLNSAGDLASCLPYWDRVDFVYGNIYQNNFKDIWHGEQRAKIKHFLEKDLDCNKCPKNCRPNAINQFLEELAEREIKHINFI